MKTYHFSGHLHPLPPGIKLSLQLSGDVCLPSDVEAELQALRDAHRVECEMLRRRIALLERNNAILKKRRAKRRSW